VRIEATAPIAMLSGKTISGTANMAREPIFYGWWMVAACLLAALVGNALGLFGAGVYLHAVVAANGWPVALISGAVTLNYFSSAVLLIPVGGGIRRFGPRSVVGFGGVALAFGVMGIGQATAPWQAYLAFLFIGIGWACLSTTAIATTLSPWFERYQGRAVSLASLGASAGGIISAPLLLLGIREIGFGPTTMIAGAIALALLLPLAVLVLRHHPQDMGLSPDGAPPVGAVAPDAAPRWTRRTALRTAALRSVVVTFGIGMMVQIGFLTHQVTFLAQSLGTPEVSMTVAGTAIAALLGRIVLARFADQIDVRIAAAAVLLLAACALSAMGLVPVPAMLVCGSIAFGLTIGNVTTLSPIIVRREFGAASFGAIFGVASCAIQLVAALGPSFYGLLCDMFGSYRIALMLAAVLDILAAAVIFAGAHVPPRPRV